MKIITKEVQIVMLPTEDVQVNIPILSPSNKTAFLETIDNSVRTGWFRSDLIHPKAKFAENGNENWVPQHLYFLSDTAIKEGDWAMSGNEIFKSKTDENAGIFKKIIATTDKNLLFLSNNGRMGVNLPKPSQAFIEGYCRNNGIDKVLVEYEVINRCCGKCIEGVDECIADKKCKQHLITGCRICYGNTGDIEALRLIADNEITISPIVEKLYTLKEVKDAYNTGYVTCVTHEDREDGVSFEQWVEDNK